MISNFTPILDDRFTIVPAIKDDEYVARTKPL
jgi:hypothetical protein